MSRYLSKFTNSERIIGWCIDKEKESEIPKIWDVEKSDGWSIFDPSDSSPFTFLCKGPWKLEICNASAGKSLAKTFYLSEGSYKEMGSFHIYCESKRIDGNVITREENDKYHLQLYFAPEKDEKVKMIWKKCTSW